MLIATKHIRESDREIDYKYGFTLANGPETVKIVSQLN